MPELTPIVAGIYMLVLVAGVALGFLLRGTQIRREKNAISASWQDQMAAQKVEHDRLAEQNTSLMQQISQYRASKKDADLRAKELSSSLKEAFDRRDELQREAKDTRVDLEAARTRVEALQSKVDSVSVRLDANTAALKEKDQKIFKLSRELESWQGRLPPLLERFRLRDREAEELEQQLSDALARLAEIESAGNQTRIEPVEPSSLTGREASNDQYDETAEREAPVPIGDTTTSDETEVSMRTSGIVAHLALPADSDDDSPAEGAPLGTASSNEEFDRSDSSSTINGTTSIESMSDDLKQIKGVGPAIEKILNDLGFFRFQQIADMSEYEIDQVAQELKGFRSRIYREDWIGQARTLILDNSDSHT